jgi:hypothetical protein
MNDHQNQKQITRRQFYSTAGIIYLLIGLVSVNTIRAGDSLGDLVRSIPAFIIGFGGVASGLLYAIKALKEKSK